MALSSAQREKLLARLQPVSDIDRKLKMVLYGEPDVGKTVLATTIGQSNLLIHSEPGFTVLTKDEHKEQGERTKVVPFTTITGIRGYVELLAEGAIDRSTLIIDNMSGIQDKKLSENHEDPKVKALNREHPDLSTLQDYQIVTHQMRPMMVELMNLDKEVIVICHMRGSVPERKEFNARPDLTKKIFDLANEKVDVVAYMYKDNGKRMIRTEHGGGFIAKSRITRETVMPVDTFVAEINAWRSKTN